MTPATGAIEAALRQAAIGGRIESVRPMTGGCVSEVQKVTLDDGRALIVKVAPSALQHQLEAEQQGLRALAATRTVLTPQPLIMCVQGAHAALVMTFLVPAVWTPAAWIRFGEDLARMHAQAVGGRYGFDHDNFIGSTPQPNGWHDDWVEFNQVNRLGHQLRLARDGSRLDLEAVATIERTIERLDELIPRRPRPSLLHGDLWSGNVVPTQGDDGTVRGAVIDPACSIGDGLADLAMMRLFGGFPSECERAYESRSGTDLSSVQTHRAIAVYQLYHVLNHANLFGGGYAGQAVSLARVALNR